MPQSAVVSVGNSWGRSRPGLVGFLWGPPEASGGSRSRLFKDFGRRLAGQIRGSARWLAGLPCSADPEGSWPDSASRVLCRPLALPGGGRVAAKTAVLGVGHDAVVGGAGAGAAGAGAVAGEHLRGGPAVE